MEEWDWEMKFGGEEGDKVDGDGEDGDDDDSENEELRKKRKRANFLLD